MSNIAGGSGRDRPEPNSPGEDAAGDAFGEGDGIDRDEPVASALTPSAGGSAASASDNGLPEPLNDGAFGEAAASSETTEHLILKPRGLSLDDHHQPDGTSRKDPDHGNTRTLGGSH